MKGQINSWSTVLDTWVGWHGTHACSNTISSEAEDQQDAMMAGETSVAEVGARAVLTQGIERSSKIETVWTCLLHQWSKRKGRMLWQAIFGR